MTIKVRGGFWNGVMFALAAYSCFQDYMGLTGYVNWVSAHWITLSPWVMGILAAFWLIKALLEWAYNSVKWEIVSADLKGR